MSEPPAAPPGRVAALDLGSVRVGLAVSDPEQTMAFPRAVLPRQPERRLLAELAHLVEDDQVVRFVVGHPLHLGGERGAQARAAEEFAERLHAALGVAVELFDERLTTVEAEELLIAADASRRRRRQVRDKVAAALLLESYLRTPR